MFEQHKMLPPDAFDLEKKHDHDMWLWEIERHTNYFLDLCVDSMDCLNYTTCLLGGDATTWWHFVHIDFHGVPSATWADFGKVVMSRWHVVLPKKGVQHKLHSCTHYRSVLHYIYMFPNSMGKLPKAINDEALDRYTRGCEPQIRVELEQVYGEAADQDLTQDLMKGIRLAKTKDKLLWPASCRF